MKIKNKANKKSWFKKIFIKICRLLDYEIIDQSNFYLPVTDQHINEDLTKVGKRSLNIPMGKVAKESGNRTLEGEIFLLMHQASITGSSDATTGVLGTTPEIGATTKPSRAITT